MKDIFDNPEMQKLYKDLIAEQPIKATIGQYAALGNVAFTKRNKGRDYG